MTTSAREIGVLLAFGLFTAAAPQMARAGRAGAQVAKLRAGAKNLAPRLGRTIEVAKIHTKARLGLHREHELVKGKARTFHRADGTSQVETTHYEVTGRRAQTELITQETHDANGRKTGEGKAFVGNTRRVLRTIREDIQTNMADPDFQAAMAGSRAASLRWSGRMEAHGRTKRPEGTPHRFVDRAGNPVTLEGAGDPKPHPVPRAPAWQWP